jgi:hypothetical protein
MSNSSRKKKAASEYNGAAFYGKFLFVLATFAGAFYAYSSPTFFKKLEGATCTLTDLHDTGHGALMIFDCSGVEAYDEPSQAYLKVVSVGSTYVCDVGYGGGAACILPEV